MEAQGAKGETVVQQGAATVPPQDVAAKLAAAVPPAVIAPVAPVWSKPAQVSEAIEAMVREATRVIPGLDPSVAKIIASVYLWYVENDIVHPQRLPRRELAMKEMDRRGWSFGVVVAALGNMTESLQGAMQAFLQRMSEETGKPLADLQDYLDRFQQEQSQQNEWASTARDIKGQAVEVQTKLGLASASAKKTGRGLDLGKLAGDALLTLRIVRAESPEGEPSAEPQPVSVWQAPSVLPDQEAIDTLAIINGRVVDGADLELALACSGFTKPQLAEFLDEIVAKATAQEEASAEALRKITGQNADLISMDKEVKRFAAVVAAVNNFIRGK